MRMNIEYTDGYKQRAKAFGRYDGSYNVIIFRDGHPDFKQSAHCPNEAHVLRWLKNKGHGWTEVCRWRA